jgi:3-hydroxybutyryl-CoA dehydratase
MEFFEEIEITKELVEKFSEVSGDKNPIHLDEEYCREFTKFEKPIAPGLLLASFFSRIIAETYPGPGSIYLSQDLKFINPCYIGESVRVSVVENKVEGNKYYLVTKILKGETVIIEGSALVLKK